MDSIKTPTIKDNGFRWLTKFERDLEKEQDRYNKTKSLLGLGFNKRELKDNYKTRSNEQN